MIFASIPRTIFWYQRIIWPHWKHADLHDLLNPTQDEYLHFTPSHVNTHNQTRPPVDGQWLITGFLHLSTPASSQSGCGSCNKALRTHLFSVFTRRFWKRQWFINGDGYAAFCKACEKSPSVVDGAPDLSALRMSGPCTPPPPPPAATPLPIISVV